MPPLKPPRAIQVDWSHPLARGLTGCWLFAEGTGDTVADTGPHRQHGSSRAGPLVWKPGEHGHCLEFDGTDGYVDCGTGKFGWDLTGEISIVSNFNHSMSESRTIFARSAFARPAKLEGVANGRVRWWVYTDGTNCNIISTSQHATDGGEWIHAVGTWSQNAGRVYVNGELEQSESSSSGNLKFVNDSQPVGIGGTYEGGTYYYPWNGKIEYVLVYNRVLSVEQIKWLYREPFVMFENSIRPTLIGVGGAIVSLAGSVSATSAALAQLESTCNPPQAEQNWFSDALFNGMTARAFKLGATLSLGWFWLPNHRLLRALPTAGQIWNK